MLHNYAYEYFHQIIIYVDHRGSDQQCNSSNPFQKQCAQYSNSPVLSVSVYVKREYKM